MPRIRLSPLVRPLVGGLCVLTGACSGEPAADGAQKIGPVQFPADLSCIGEKVRWLRDADGDGRVDPSADVFCAQPGQVLEGFVAAEGTVLADCDDANPGLGRWAWTAAPQSAFVCTASLGPNEEWVPPDGSHPNASCSIGWKHRSVDRDGDGYQASIIHRCVPAESPELAAIRINWDGVDCNDADPNTFTEGYWDGDEDGVPDVGTKSCLGLRNVAEAPDWSRPGNGLDCAPDDPARSDRGRFDRDADGYPYIEGCYPKGEAPDVTLPVAVDVNCNIDIDCNLDCDDDNAAVNPGAVEQFDDDVDSNCDGDDAPHCRSVPMLALAPTSGECSDTADVAVAAVLECTRPCEKPVVHIQLQNRGHVLFDGTIRVTAKSDDYTWVDEFHAVIAPGDGGFFQQLSIERRDLYRVGIETDRVDCTPSNDALDVSVVGNRCRVPE